MKVNVLIKRIVDAAMYVLFLILMGQCVMRGAVHDWLGIAIGALFIMHNALNIKWYAALFKGKYTPLRMVQLIINLLFIIAVLICMISGIWISQHIFAIASGSAIELGRHLHLVATAWAFILMTLHLGQHWSIFAAIGKRISISASTRRRIRIALCICASVLCLYGLYQFVHRRFWEEMFHLIDYQKEYDSSKSPIAYFIGTAAISSVPIAAAHFMKKRLLCRRK